MSQWCYLVAWAAGVLVVDLPTASAQTSKAAEARTPEIEFYSVDVGALVAKFDQSHIVSDPAILEPSFYQMDTAEHVAVPAGGEAYLLPPETPNDEFRGYRIVGTKPRGEPISGKLFALRRHPEEPRESVLAQFNFSVAADIASVASREDFLRAKGRHAQRLWSEEMAGAAMFRHVAVSSLKEVGEKASSTGPAWPLRRRRGGVDETIQLTSGGRAVSENLDLDARLGDGAEGDGTMVPLSQVKGIQVRAIDWSDLLRNQETPLDPLAKRIPHDQYAAFLPSFEALTRIIDRGGELAKPLVQWFEPQSRKTDVLAFYQRQLGLPLNVLTRQVGGVLIDEVAVTGSDPYFRTGTDIAVLMRSDQPTLLHQSILAQVKTFAATHRGAKRVEHKLDGHFFTQWSTTNRDFSSFVALLDDSVVVCNSLHQMTRILQCFDGRLNAMHDLDEYRFFRQRYPRDSVNASALIVVTDAAIRRWCGPKWRISASRRTRGRATIAEVTVQHADDLIRGNLTGTTEIHSPDQMPDAGSLQLTADGVFSKTYGSLDFQTPIAEMDLKQATAGEVEMYTNWRDRYERRWRRVFDPIALQLSLDEQSISADLSVIPLVVQTEYRMYRSLVGDVHLKPSAGDPHPEMLAAITMALDTDSQLFQFARGWLSNNTNLDLMAWIDGSISVYLDHDQQWMQRLDDRSPWRFDMTDLQRDIPVGFFVPSKDNLRMTAFVIAVRSMIEQFTPNMIRWETAKHKNLEYVAGTVLQGAAVGQAEDMPRLYYVTTSEGLTLSANSGVIERAIDRHLVRAKSALTVDPDQETEIETDPSTTDPSAGPQLVMQSTGKGADVMSRTNYRSGLERMHRIAWSNIPILNHFRSRYPGRDPMAVYRQLLGETLVEPSGGTYVWNADRGTYVSSLHGYHLEPKAGPAIASALGEKDEIKTTLSFQDGGIRATLKVQHQ